MLIIRILRVFWKESIRKEHELKVIDSICTAINVTDLYRGLRKIPYIKQAIEKQFTLGSIYRSNILDDASQRFYTMYFQVWLIYRKFGHIKWGCILKRKGDQIICGVLSQY